MKLKRRRAVEVPPKIKSFISGVLATPLENIEEPLKGFVWDFDKGDFHHWVDLFNYFDTFFEKHIKSRKDLLIEDDFLDLDPSFPREAVLQILRVVRVILDNCTNKHFYSSYEHHLSSLLASTDVDVVEACLHTLAAFLKKSIGKHTIRDASLNSKLYAFAQGWGGKEEGLGLVTCAINNDSDSTAHQLGSTLHFEFYVARDSSKEDQKQGLQIIHLPKVNTCQQSDLELMQNLVKEYNVPVNLRFSLLTRLRFARAFHSFDKRQQFTCIRLHAFILLVQACGETGDLVTFFNTEPEFIKELVTLLSYEDVVSENVRVLCLLSLAALCQDRSRQPTVLSAVTSGAHRGILSSLMHKAIDAVATKSSNSSVVFAEALISLVTVLVSSSSGCFDMRESGFIPTLLPLLKDINPQHLHLVSSSVHVLEAFMDYSNPAAALFRDLGGLDDTIFRLKVEVSHVENGSKIVNVDGAGSSNVDIEQPIYSEALVSYHRKSLMKALLRAISLGTYAPGTTSRVYGSEESLLPYCLRVIFQKAKDFGGGVFSLAAVVMSDLIHKDPTCYPILEASGLPSAFLDAIMDGVLCSSEAITCIPQCLDALCLNNSGLQAVKDRNALRCLVKIFTTRTYSRVLTGDTPSALSSGLDELMRHASSLRGHGVDVVIEILKAIETMGNGSEATSVPMETDAEKLPEASTDTSLSNIEAFLPDCVNNVARLLETILQNTDMCRIFIEKKGVEAVLQLFTLPLMPSYVSIGQSIAVAFKNFSVHHSASLVRAICLFMREHLKSTNELLVSLGGMQLSQVEDDKRTKVLRRLSSLEGILSLLNALTKGTMNLVSELGTSDPDSLKDLGATFREILWQQSLCCDSKIDEKQQNVDSKSENVNANANAGASNSVERDAIDDVAIPVVRYTNPVSVRNNSQLALEREFLSMVRNGEGFNRRSRHGLARIRGGRTGRHLELLHLDSDSLMNNTDTTSSQEVYKRKTPEALVIENLNKLSSTLRSSFIALVKGFTSPIRRRVETGTLSLASKNVATALAKVFLEALTFSGYTSCGGHDSSLSLKCGYLGKVVDHMAALTFDNRRRTCYPVMVNHFYVQGTLKELLNTFEATSQLLWTPRYSVSTSGVDHENNQGSKSTHGSWLLNTLESYCNCLEYFVTSSFILPQAAASQAHLVLQPVAVGLSIGLFPVPKDPKMFVKMLQSQVLDAILPVWNHPMFPSCDSGFITKIVTLLNHVYTGVSDAKVSNGGGNHRFNVPLPDEATITTIIEMGFTRARAEEALRRVERNSVELAMEWLFTHPEDPAHEDDDLAQALALSLGSSSETPKAETTEKSDEAETGIEEIKAPPVDDILSAIMKLVGSSDSIAFSLTDLFVTLCNRDKGEDRTKVISYLIQQLKLCPLETLNDTSALCTISHTLALLLSEDITTREIAAENGIVSITIDILTDFNVRTKSQDEILVPKSISALLLILDTLLQSRPITLSDSNEGTKTGPLPESMGEQTSPLAPHEPVDKNLTPAADEETNDVFEKIFGKSTGYLTIEEGNKLLTIVCDMIKQHVPGMVMQAVILLCARLTKTHTLALQFLENGGMDALFSIPRTCFFAAYDTLASVIIRHLLEDPQTLQTAMELEIRQILSANRHVGRITPQVFLTSMAPLISRDPDIFMKAASTVCQLESSGGRTVVVLSKEKEKEKEKSKVAAVEIGAENKSQETPVKSKGQKKIPANLTQVIHHLLEVIMKHPSLNPEEECIRSENAMEVDEPSSSKGKSKVDESKKESDSLPERSEWTDKVTFVLKLLSDILQMYVHAVGILLKRDLEMCGIVHRVVHQFLHPPVDKTIGSDESKAKLSEKASLFLVVLCGRSSEGRRRVINELVKVLSSFSNSATNSSKGSLLPDKKVVKHVDVLYSILMKNPSANSNIHGSPCSPEIVKAMMDGGIIPCLSSILEVVDLDHPDAPKLVNITLKVLEALSLADQHSLSDVSNKKKSVNVGPTSDNQTVNTSTNQTEDAQQQLPQHEHDEGEDGHSEPAVEEMRIDMEAVEATEELGMGFMHEEMEDNGVLHNTGDDDDDMGDDDDDDDEEDEEDIAEDGNGLMSLADTDVDDHDEVGLVSEYNDEEDEEYHENRVMEVRWREALDDLRQMQVLGQPGLADMAVDPFEGVHAHDLFGVRRPLGFDRRRQQASNRTTAVERSGGAADGNSVQHPLLSRPSASSSRNLESLPGDVAHFNMIFDDAVPPLEHVHSGRRGSGDSRWTDDGQPQPGGQASAIADAIQDHFMSLLQPAPLVSQSGDPVPVADDDDQPPQQNDAEIDHTIDVVNEDLEAHNMEVVEGDDDDVSEQELQRDRMSATDGDNHAPVEEATDVDMNVAESEANEDPHPSGVGSSSEHNTEVAQETDATTNVAAGNDNGIDPTFLEALPEELRAEVLASHQPPPPAPAPAPASSPSVAEEIDPEFLAALPPDIQAEVLAQQRAQRLAQQAEGQPVDMDNASIIATFPADLRHEVLLTSSQAVLSALPSPLLAEAQMLRDRAMSHYQARSLFGGGSNHNHRLNNRRNGLGFGRQTVVDRGVGVTIGRRPFTILPESLRMEFEGEPIIDTDAIKALIRLLRLAQPLAKGTLQRVLLNVCAHSSTRATTVYLLLEMIKPETESQLGALTGFNSQRLYGCQSNVVYGRSQLIDGLPPLVLHKALELLTYLATNHASVGEMLFYFDHSRVPESLNPRLHDKRKDKGKQKVVEGAVEVSMEQDVPILLFIKLLNDRLFPRSISHLEQVLGLLQVVVYTAASKLESQSRKVTSSEGNEPAANPQTDSNLAVEESGSVNKSVSDGLSASDDQESVDMYDIFMKLPQTDLQHLCTLLGHEGLSDKVYTLTGEVLNKLASVAPSHRKFFMIELSDLAHSLSSSAIHELRNTQMLSGSMAGSSVLRILQTLNSLTLLSSNETKDAESDNDQEHITMWKLNVSLEPLWQELSECITVTESQLAQGSSTSVASNTNVVGEQAQGSSSLSSPLPHGTQRLLPFIEAFMVLCEKLQTNSSTLQQDNNTFATASEVKQLTGSSTPNGVDSQRRTDGGLTFTRFAEKHRRLLNAFVRQDPTLLEKSLSMLLKAPRLMDFDNKKSYFRSRIRQQHDHHHLAGPLRISVRRAYILEDSYNQLRMRPTQDMKGRLNVHFQGEEGIDAGGLTREWYQVLSRVIFDKGTLLFTTGGNNATFQPNPNSVYQTEHLSYFKFVGRVVAKALFDGQLLDVYFTRSFYKHILGAKVTYHDIEAVDPDYYKNLKWMLENDVSDIPDLTFSMDADEEKHILYEKTEVTDYELKPGGGNIRVTEETKHEYVDLVAEHILTNAIRPQINSFLEGFNELIPRELVSIFNDKELELLISGLPEIDFDDLKANTEYTGYTVGSNVIIWFWEVVKAFNKEDRARFLQFVTGTSKVPLEGFKALQGISGPQRFQIHKAYGAPKRLPSAHTCFNQIDLPEYMTKEQLQERLLLAIHEASEGFGFG